MSGKAKIDGKRRLRMASAQGTVTPPATPSYIVREEYGTSKLTLEEGGGSLLTEESG